MQEQFRSSIRFSGREGNQTQYSLRRILEMPKSTEKIADFFLHITVRCLIVLTISLVEGPLGRCGNLFITILSPYFSNEIMWKAEMNEDEAGFRMRESKYNLRYEHNIIRCQKVQKSQREYWGWWNNLPFWVCSRMYDYFNNLGVIFNWQGASEGEAIRRITLKNLMKVLKT